MANKYSDTYGRQPDLSDPGLASDLASEAIEDAKRVASDVADRVKDEASNAAGQISRHAKAAYDHPAEYAELSLRAFERYVRDKPLEAIAVTAGIALAAGALWGWARR